MTESSADAVLFRQVTTQNDRRIGVAQLNAEKSLNALTLPMIRLLDPQLRQWARDPAMACVILHGAGEKAFCAGGDIRNLYRAMKNPSDAPPGNSPRDFFSEEYRLDHLIHTYPKPIVVWGSGIVMGGGLGLMAGASHRIVTPTSRVAMPEITIGLFPDVGASYFLNRMPQAFGRFLAFTGASINANDLRLVGLADHFVAAADRQAIVERLTALDWSGNGQTDRAALTVALNEFSARAAAELPESNLARHRAAIEEMTAGDSLAEVYARIVGYAGDDPWLQRAARSLAAGSPTTAALIWELQRRAPGLSLADVFRLELIVALQCCAHPDLAEGVRALLIDKDNQPHWTPPTLASVTREWIEQHFTAPPWPDGRHPLADLR